MAKIVLSDIYMQSVGEPYRDACVVSFQGPPCTGKSTLTQAVVAALRKEDLQVCLFAVEPTDRALLYWSDRLLAHILIITFFLRTIVVDRSVLTNRKMRARWFRWAARVRREWVYSAICRRHLRRLRQTHDVVIVDSRLVSKYLFELADPRNCAGMRLMPLAIWWERRLPMVRIDGSVITIASTEVLMDRAQQRLRNIVRRDLTMAEKALFFDTARAFVVPFASFFQRYYNITPLTVHTDKLDIQGAVSAVLAHISVGTSADKLGAEQE